MIQDYFDRNLFLNRLFLYKLFYSRVQTSPKIGRIFFLSHLYTIILKEVDCCKVVDFFRFIWYDLYYNYVDYLSKSMRGNEFVIFHGGQYSPSKRRFLSAVAEAAADRQWFHWGDIDFSMLTRLRREISPSILPYRMDKEELLRYGNLTARFAPTYGERLKWFLADAIMKDCWNCIEFMIERKIKLEQEAMLTQLK